MPVNLTIVFILLGVFVVTMIIVLLLLWLKLRKIKKNIPEIDLNKMNLDNHYNQQRKKEVYSNGYDKKSSYEAPNEASDAFKRASEQFQGIRTEKPGTRVRDSEFALRNDAEQQGILPQGAIESDLLSRESNQRPRERIRSDVGRFKPI